MSRSTQNSKTPHAQTRHQRSALRVNITRHERGLLVVYRALTAEGQDAVDRTVSVEWTRPKPYDPNGQEANARFGVALRQLKADDARTDWLVYFANVGLKAGGAR